MTEPHISCLVVAFHRPELLSGLLGALVAEDLEVVVVNVEADDDVGDVAASFGARIENVPSNPGYAAAVNRGVAVARGSVIVFMNDDLVVSAAAVRSLAEVVDGGPGRVAVPAIHSATGDLELTILALPTPGRLAWEWMLLPDRPVSFLATVLRPEKWRSPRSTERIVAATGAIVATTRDALVEEPLPEAYFLYWEEMEWFWRLARRGTEVLYLPSITVTHLGGREDTRAAKSRLLARNAVRCVRRTQGPSAAAVAWAAVVGWNIRLVAVAAARGVAGGRPWGELGARLAGLAAAARAIGEVR
jgi:GT2 family glycosyltransferase